MDEQNPGWVGLDRTGAPAAADNRGVSKQPPVASALSKIGDVAQQTGNQVKQQAGALAVEAGEKAKGFLGNQVEAGADLLGHIGRSATAAADTLEPNVPQLAGLVRGMATSVADLSNTVRGKSPDQLVEAASSYVRQNPALVMGAAALCGFALTRLLRGGTWNGSRAGARSGPGMPTGGFDAV